MPLRCATMTRKDNTKYVFCSGSKDGKPAKKDKPKKKNKPVKINKRITLKEEEKEETKEETKGDRYDFRVEWKDPTGTKREKFFQAIKKKQGNRSSISYDEIYPLHKGILDVGTNVKQTPGKVKQYVDYPKRGFVQRNGVKKL